MGIMLIKVCFLLLALCFIGFSTKAYKQFKRASDGELRGVLAGSIVTYWILAIYNFIKLLLA